MIFHDKHLGHGNMKLKITVYNVECFAAYGFDFDGGNI